MKKPLRLVVFVVAIIALLILPVVPISRAPVIPNPTYSLDFISLGQLLVRFFSPLVGISYRWEWGTPLVLLALLAVGIGLGVWAFRRDGP
jgi:hypothetical protein